MKPEVFSFLFCYLIGNLTHAQSVEWASQVIDYSSEASPVEYSVFQVLGEPNVLPLTEINANAWSPGKPRKEHFIMVGFERPLRIRQTAIAESFNPGALKKVTAFDPDGDEYTLFTLEPKQSVQKGRMFNFFFEETLFEVNALKLVFDGTLYDGQFYIDAIAISDSDIPIRASINRNVTVRQDITVEPLGDKINSPVSEIRPLLSPDGKTLYFSRKHSQGNLGGLDDQEDIWISTFDEQSQTWTKAENAGAPLNNKGQNFINAIVDYDNLTLAILGNQYGKGDKMKAGMSVSNGDNGDWSQPVNMDFSNEPGLVGDYDFSMNHDRTAIILAVKRKDTYGGKDLYVSFLLRTGVWSEPINIGETLNTVMDESSPFLNADGKTLYFSSEGFSGYGGSDIFVSHRLDDSWKNWSPPENLGAAINSDLDDKYFTIPASGEYAYFSRYISDSNADIVRVSLPLYEESPSLIAVEANIIDEATGQPVESQVILNQGSTIMVGNSFRVDMEAGRMYRCRIEAYGYEIHDELIDLTGQNLGDYLSVQISLKKEEEKLTFDNIVFASNQAMLLEQSFPSLNQLTDLLINNDEIAVIIASHTDNVGSEQDNLALSKLRAEAIRDYLSQKGVDPERMKIEWHGESRPVASNETDEGRRKNRRVEFTIKR